MSFSHKLLQAVHALAEDPRPRASVKMCGTGSLEDWRVRVGDYRIVYRVDDEAREVLNTRGRTSRERIRLMLAAFGRCRSEVRRGYLYSERGVILDGTEAA